MALKSDLIYRGINEPFFLPVTLKEGEKCSVERMIDGIIKEDVATCTSQISADMFKGAVGPLKKMLDNIDDVSNSFKTIVDETAQSRETGRTVGWALELQLKKLIPQDLVGGKKNKDNILKNFRKSFLFGKEDIIPIFLLTDGLIMKKIAWMRTLTSPSFKQSMMVALVKWLWRVAKRLVASCFHVSDTQGAPNQLVYVPKKVWKAETDRAFNCLSPLQPLTAAEAQQLAAVRKPATLRWMPKSEGLRPILSVRDDKKSPDTIKAKQLVLSLVQRCHFQVNAKHLHSIWKGLVDLHCQGKKMYFVACDIHDAFGSVKQDKMIAVLEEEIIRLHGSVGLFKFENEICTIKNAVKCQTLRKLKKTYHLTKGLAQGMALSSPLCNLYLTHMDRTCLAGFTSEPDDKLIRAVDDYLYITPDKTKAQLFLATMTSGLHEYGVKIKSSKTQTNLEGDLEILYYGYLINTANLEVYARYSQGINVSSRNSMVFKVAPILLLEDKLVHMALNKLNRLTLDRRYMTVEGVARNVLHTACVLARRLTAVLALTRPCDTPEAGRLVDLVTRSAEAVAGRVYSVGASLARDASMINSAGNVFACLTKEEIKWVVLRAFSMILSRAAPMKRSLPDGVVMLVSELEEVAKAAVRDHIIHLVTPVVTNVPSQFRNFDDD